MQFVSVALAWLQVYKVLSFDRFECWYSRLIRLVSVWLKSNFGWFKVKILSVKFGVDFVVKAILHT